MTRWKLSSSHSAAAVTTCPVRTSSAKVRYASRSTRALSSNRGKMLRARRHGLGSMVKLAARASARSSSRSMLSSSSRNGFSDAGALVCDSSRKNCLIGSARDCRPELYRSMQSATWALQGMFLVRAEGQLGRWAQESESASIPPGILDPAPTSSRKSSDENGRRSTRLGSAPEPPELQLDRVERLDARRHVARMRIEEQPATLLQTVGLERFGKRIDQPDG